MIHKSHTENPHGKPPSNLHENFAHHFPRGAGNAPREKVAAELPSPLPSLEPPPKEDEDVMDQARSWESCCFLMEIAPRRSKTRWELNMIKVY